MSSPGGGIAGAPYVSDSQFRTMIRTIIISPSPPAQSSGADTPGGPNSFQQFQHRIQVLYGSFGQWWPEPGLSKLAKQEHVPDDANLKIEEENSIQENYQLATLGTGTVQPYEDPGIATPGAGPLPKLDLQGILGKWAIRIGEGLAGLLLVGIGVNAMTKRQGSSSGGITRAARTVSKVVK